MFLRCWARHGGMWWCWCLDAGYADQMGGQLVGLAMLNWISWDILDFEKQLS